MQPDQLVYVFDEPPETAWGRDPAGDPAFAINEEGLPSIVVEVLTRIAEAFDSAECEAYNHDPEVIGTIGWYRIAADDGEYTEFESMAVVVPAGEKPYAICEDCHAALLPKEAI